MAIFPSRKYRREGDYMAKSGTINNTFRTGYAIRVVWEVTSQSEANNTSSVTAKVQLVSLGSSYTINSSASKSGTLTINGTKYSFTFTASLSSNQTKTLFTKSVTVTHNSDGTKTCAFSATAGIDVTLSGTYWGDVTASGNGVFDTIARASSISSVTASVAVNGTNTCTVNIDRKSSAFTHTVVWKIGSYSKTTTGAGTSSSYAIPTSWLNAIPNATEGTATVQVTTYNGSTKIGSTVSKTFKITVPSTVVPSISSVTLAEAESGIATQFGGYVQNKSKLKVTISATGVYSSTIKSYKTTILGKNYTASSFTSGFLTSSGTVNVAVTVTDSRGRTATTTKSVTVIAYKVPTITSFTGFRSLANGTENYEGTYLNAFINYSIASVGSKNTATYSIEYKLKTATTWTVLTSGTAYALNINQVSASAILGIDNSYDIRLTIKDFFGTATSTFDIPTAFTLIDYNASGKGIAFGKVSERDGIEFAMKTYFSNAETPSSMIYLQEGQDFNDILEPGFYCIPTTAVSGTLVNKPWSGTATGGLMVIREGDGLGKCQIAHKLSKDDGAIYERSYYQSAWGEWQCVHDGKGKILWTGGMYMTSGHVISFSEPASKQPSGIVLVFSEYYDAEVKNQSFASFFVPRRLIESHSGSGHCFWMSTSNVAYIATKYLYIRDDGITGHNNNNLVITNSGVTLNNNRFVLRYVLGV